ncbi:SDR family oxidoreductase [Congregibacter litoralis]|uniref:Dehydrogenase n=1 Tax=Congregibacter litoralis KT71 TaxID=314285 RepID=A4A4Z0_9GAMM|nr:SDR family oxidoreductase [Congregibacter litoralis]EAQ98861.2 Dehydrogenase with unknown specificity [Congregibacter litoralis KT71]
MATVLITGVNRGLGLEFIRQYAAAGWTVLGTCRDPDNAVEAKALAAAEPCVTLYKLDVGDTDAIAELADTLRGTAIDVLILNAGVMAERTGLGTLKAEEFQHVMNINVVAPAMLIQAFADHVAASEKKVIVGMGSTLGSIGGNNSGGLYSYRSSKAGLHAIMKNASIDLKEKAIIAIAMHPGWVVTDMGGHGADIQTDTSIAGMMAVIEQLTPDDSGRLLTYTGEELPW